MTWYTLQGVDGGVLVHLHPAPKLKGSTLPGKKNLHFVRKIDRLHREGISSGGPSDPETFFSTTPHYYLCWKYSPKRGIGCCIIIGVVRTTS